MTSQQSKPTVDEMRSVDKNGEKAVHHREKPPRDPNAKGAEEVPKVERGKRPNAQGGTDRPRN